MGYVLSRITYWFVMMPKLIKMYLYSYPGIYLPFEDISNDNVYVNRTNYILVTTKDTI